MSIHTEFSSNVLFKQVTQEARPMWCLLSVTESLLKKAKRGQKGFKKGFRPKKNEFRHLARVKIQGFIIMDRGRKKSVVFKSKFVFLFFWFFICNFFPIGSR